MNKFQNIFEYCNLEFNMMDLNQALTWATEKLKNHNFDSATLDAEILLALTIKKNKEYLYSYAEQQLTKEQERQFKKLIKKRLSSIPIAYLTGEKEFYGLKFRITKHVLVPRPLSEEIIDKALEKIKNESLIPDTKYMICDVGTGSGCLIISLANELKKLKILNNFELVATDISGKALKIAKENAKFYNLEKNITFLKGNLLKPIIKRFALNAKGGRVDLIITNLPYLTKDQVKNEPSIKKEPKKALIGDYDTFFKQLKDLNPQPTVIYEDKSRTRFLVRDKNGVTIFSP